MEMNYNKLKGRIVEICGSQKEFAQRVGATEQRVCGKLAGKRAFTQDEVIEWSNVLGLEPSDIGVYFFTPQIKQQ